MLSKQNKILLTGDVHHLNMKGSDFQYFKGKTELELTETYLDIANMYNIEPIIFITGMCVNEEHQLLKRYMKKYSFVIGGHTYYANKYFILYNIFYKFKNYQNGPYFFQNWEVRKTISTFKKYLCIDIKYWRNHGYRIDKNTNTILIKNGIEYVSNLVDEREFDVLTYTHNNKKMYEYPINTLPDHENLIHSLDHYGGISITKWLQIVKNQVSKILENNGVATILAHPACMWIEDNFNSFEQLCKFINKIQI